MCSKGAGAPVAPPSAYQQFAVAQQVVRSAIVGNLYLPESCLTPPLSCTSSVQLRQQQRAVLAEIAPELLPPEPHPKLDVSTTEVEQPAHPLGRRVILD